MGTTLQVYSISQVEAIRDYLDNISVTNGMYIYKIHDEIYILDW